MESSRMGRRRLPSLLGLAAAFALVLAAPLAHASIAWQGSLSAPHFMSDGVVIVYSSGSRANVPACGSGQSGRFAFDSTTLAGRSQLAGLLAAFAAGRRVVIVGTDTCSVYSDSETISYFYIYD